MADALRVVGAPWTLLILREAFAGAQRFEEWQGRLSVARNVLATRLKELVEQGVFERVLYCQHPRRYTYRLTPRGLALRPVLVELARWGKAHGKHLRARAQARTAPPALPGAFRR